MLIVLALIIGFVRSVSVFLWVDNGEDLHEVLPLWGFGFVMIGMYLPFARVSLQEFLGYSYTTFYGSLVMHWAAAPLVMIFVVTLQSAESQADSDSY